MTSKLTFGRDLRIGDTVDVWWGTHRDTIVSLRPHSRHDKDRVAEFAVNQTGMTIEAGALFEVFHRVNQVSA